MVLIQCTLILAFPSCLHGLLTKGDIGSKNADCRDVAPGNAFNLVKLYTRENMYRPATDTKLIHS